MPNSPHVTKSLDTNIEEINEQLKYNILNGFLLRSVAPYKGQANRMQLKINAGHIEIPDTGVSFSVPNVHVVDRYSASLPVKKLVVNSFSDVALYDDGGISEFDTGGMREAPADDIPDDPDAYEDELDNVVSAIRRDELMKLAATSREVERSSSQFDPFNNPAKPAKVSGQFNSVAAVSGLENKSPEFIAELINIGNKLNIDPSFMAAIMLSESRMDHTIINKHGGATGLIQFMPSTAKNLGTSTDELRGMTDVEQLAYVEKFFKPWAGRIKNAGDLYMATFLPIFVGKPAGTIIGQKGNQKVIAGKLTYDKVYRYNAGLDSNKDGTIHASDVTGRAEKYYRLGNARGRINPSTESIQSNAIAQGKGMNRNEKPRQQDMVQQPQQEQQSREYANDLMSFLFASGPIEKIVKRALYERSLPKTRALITIGSLDQPFHARIRLAKIISTALRQELDAESSIHNHDNKIEIETDVVGSKEAVQSALRGVCNGVSSAYKVSTDVYDIDSRIFINASSKYALVDDSVLESSFRKFAFDMAAK